jgi:hypothetical protein
MKRPTGFAVVFSVSNTPSSFQLSRSVWLASRCHYPFSCSFFPLCRMCQLMGEDKMTAKTSEPLPLYSPTVEDGMELRGWQQVRGTIEKLTQLIRIFCTNFWGYPLQSAMYLAVCKFGCNPWTINSNPTCRLFLKIDMYRDMTAGV